MEKQAALTILRKSLIQKGLQAIIIPSNDPHFGEYTQEHYAVRAWLSNFSGTAGTLVVTESNAALWTDSRYFIVAAENIKGLDIELMKLKMPNTPTVSQWIKSLYPNGAKVAVDHALFSVSEYNALSEALDPCTIELLPDPFDSIWEGRPALVFNKILALDKKYSGEETYSKASRIRVALREMNGGKENFAYIVSACDETAWLCNIRGSDIEYNPVAQAYSIITDNSLHLFVNIDSLSTEARKNLKKQNVEIHPYNSFTTLLKNLSNKTIIFSEDKMTIREYRILKEAGASFIHDTCKGSIVNMLKAIKNECEISGYRKAFLKDGIAWCKFLKYIDDSLKSGKELDEYSLGLKLIEFRKECEDYRGESFEPIIAFGKGAALPHYSATANNSAKIGTNNFLLMDTGAHYWFGTTDTTRTIPIGTITETQKRHYTLVLKGMIDLARAKFPKNTRGSQLDILARGPLFNEALMYFHGTCHGIGHYLCVHEGPQSIRMEENPVTISPGMIMSDEPAIYFEGEYGIRTENVILVKNWKKNNMNEFYEFETMTLVPIATSCIIKELLTKEENDWVENYNKNLRTSLAPYLSPEENDWLANLSYLN